MTTGRQYLRAHQRDHSLVLLAAAEFAALIGNGNTDLPARHAEHFSRVLRRTPGWNAIVGNGVDRICAAVIEAGKIRLKPETDGRALEFEAQAHRVSIAQAWIKPKALSLVLQKCAELGVAEILLFDSAYSAPRSEKPYRIDAILENACMQAYNPVKPAVRFVDNVAALQNARQPALFGDPTANVWLNPAGAAKDSIFICGPEGGFSATEMQALRTFASGVLISENVLRAETAAIIAAGILCLGK